MYKLEEDSQNINNPAVSDKDDVVMWSTIAATLLFLALTILAGSLGAGQRRRAAKTALYEVVQKVL